MTVKTPDRSLRRRRVPLALLGSALLVMLSGCSSLSMPKLTWPFGAKAAPAAQAVDEIVFETGDGSAAPAYPQYWKRNTWWSTCSLLRPAAA